MIEDMKIFHSTYEFIKWVHTLLNKFPKSEKYTMAQKIENTSLMSHKQSLALIFAMILIGIMVLNVSAQEIEYKKIGENSIEIIEIVDADQLDSNRSFIEDIYNKIYKLDNITKTIPAGNYIRIKFEQNLTKEKDITIYAKSNNGGSVEVYEKDSSYLLATFNEITAEILNYRKLLTNLNGTQDTFDLKIIGGSVEFDYITDPTYLNYTTGQAIYGVFAGGQNTNYLNLTCQLRACALSDCSDASWNTYTNNTFSNLSSLPNVSFFQFKSIFSTQNQNYTHYLFNFTIGYTTLNNGPTISIVYPSTDGLWFASNTLGINYTFSEASPDTCWWNLNNGVNTTISCGTNISGETWNQGINNVTIYINNSGGLSASAIRTFNVDTINPNATLVGPGNGTYNSTTSQNFTTNLTDNLGIKNATLYIFNQSGEYNQTTITFVSDTIQTTLRIVVTMIDGVYNWFYKAFDWAGNNYTTQNNTLTIDTILPGINIVYPQNTTYNTIPTALNYTYTEINPSSCWYSNDTYLINTTILGCSNLTINWTEGQHNVTVWVNDSAGNVNSSRVMFYIDGVYPQINFTHPTENSGVSKLQDFIYINTTWTEINFKNITFNIYNSTGKINATTYTSPTYTINFTNLSDNFILYFYNVTICDLASNCNSTETRNITLFNDITPPNLTINLINRSTYSFPEQINLTLITNTSNDTQATWYNIDLGTNITFTNQTGILFSQANGETRYYNIYVYANDSVGNINWTHVYIAIAQTGNPGGSREGGGGYILDSKSRICSEVYNFITQRSVNGTLDYNLSDLEYIKNNLKDINISLSEIDLYIKDYNNKCSKYKELSFFLTIPTLTDKTLDDLKNKVESYTFWKQFKYWLIFGSIIGVGIFIFEHSKRNKKKKKMEVRTAPVKLDESKSQFF